MTVCPVSDGAPGIPVSQGASGCRPSQSDALQVGLRKQLQSLYPGHAKSSPQPGMQSHTHQSLFILAPPSPELYFIPQNANLASSRDAHHSSSMSDMAISPLSPFSPTDNVFWDSDTPPKVSII